MCNQDIEMLFRESTMLQRNTILKSHLTGGYNALPFQNIVRHQALNPFNP